MTQDRLIQTVGDETLVYDERRHKAFCLDRIASAIWHHADGTRTVPEIAAASRLQLDLPVDEDTVLYALAQLQRDGLLKEAPQDGGPADFTAMSTLSRRAMMSKVGVGTAMMVPVIAAVVAPRAAQALSGCVQCSPSSQPRSRRPPSQ